MPIFKWRGTAGGDVSSLDAEMAKQIEQTGLDRAGSSRFHVRLHCSAVVAVYADAESLSGAGSFGRWILSARKNIELPRMAGHAYLLLWVAVLFVIFQAPLILSRL